MKAILFLFLLLTSSPHKEKWDDNKEDWTPLMFAIYENNTKKITSLIDKKADVTYRIKTSFRLDAMNIAVFKDNNFAVSKLISTKKFKNFQEYFESACGQKSLLNVEAFLKQGVHVNEYYPNGHSVLMSASSFGTSEIVECLLKHKAEVNHQRNVDGITALMLAAFNGDVKKVEILLKYGADKTIKDGNGEYAYHYVDQIYPRLNVSDETKKQLKELLKI